MAYQEGELEELHRHLYEVLSRTIEVCERLGIAYYIIGGSAVGAHFDGAILPWDDDIDIGMERGDYERFVREAQGEFGDMYFVQSFHSEPLTPYYFAKVRKVGTRFEGEDEVGLAIHHGIYIDIFPMDRVPACGVAERLQRLCVRNLCNAFTSTTTPLRSGGALQRFVVELFGRVVGKRRTFTILEWTQRLYNKRDTKYVNIIKMPRDHIERAMLHPPQRVTFGGLEVNAPRELERYLRWHYPGLRRSISVEEQVNHAPHRLNFAGED